MPLYEYECEKCQKRTEALQRFDDPPLITCPACGGPLRRLLSAPAFQFKGSGWYVTDYAGKGSGEDKEKKEAAESSGESKKKEGEKKVGKKEGSSSSSKKQSSE
jgi:putative FmdB family regulatory protein